MSKLTEQQQKDKALKAYRAIVAPAYRAYAAKLVEIYKQPDKEIIIVEGKKYKLIGDQHD